MKKIAIAAAGILMIVSTAAIAGQTVTLYFPQQGGTFYCVVNDTQNPNSTVNIDTSRVNINGFCAGQPYVIGSGGHIANMPINMVNQYAFSYVKGLGGSVKVTANSDSATIACNYDDAGRPHYGNGCYGLNLINPPEASDLTMRVAPRNTVCSVA